MKEKRTSNKSPCHRCGVSEKHFYYTNVTFHTELVARCLRLTAWLRQPEDKSPCAQDKEKAKISPHLVPSSRLFLATPTKVQSSKFHCTALAGWHTVVVIQV